MKIVLLDGGLCNQMTQYIFARCLEEELKDTDEQVFLDDLWFFERNKNIDPKMSAIENHEYQLNKFPDLKKVALMSEYFDPDVWEEIIDAASKMPPVVGGSHLPQILKDNGLDFFMIAEAPLFQFDGMIARMPYYHFMPEMLKSQGNAYYFGWFTNGGWFMSHEDMFRKEFALPPLWLPEDLEMAQMIADSTAVSVHIRRGYYASWGRTTPETYFKDNIHSICSRLKKNTIRHVRKPCFFVFSDEIDWVKEHAKDFGLTGIPYPVVYCKPNRGKDENQCDMQLMSMCDIMILEMNSVYSYMAALLNNKKNKIVINPNKGRGVF